MVLIAADLSIPVSDIMDSETTTPSVLSVELLDQLEKQATAAGRDVDSMLQSLSMALQGVSVRFPSCSHLLDHNNDSAAHGYFPHLLR